MNPAEIQQLLQRGVAELQAGKPGAAEPFFRQVLSASPEHPDALHLLGLIASKSGRHDDAADRIRRAILQRPDWAEAYFNLGFTFELAGKPDEAVAAYVRAAELKPDFFEALTNLGNALDRHGRPADAAAIYRRAIAVRPQVAETHSNLAAMLNKTGQYPAAITAAEAAIALRPDYAKAYNNLGVALAGLGKVDAAIDASGKAFSLDPKLFQAITNLGAGLLSRGQWQDALAAYRQAMNLHWEDSNTESAMLFAMNYAPGVDLAAMALAQDKWNQWHAKPLQKHWRPHDNDRDPDRPLRIGYVSADFRNHPVGRFLLPLLVHHDRRRFDIFAYSQTRLADEMTARFRSEIPNWREIANVTDDAVVDLIRADGIDILIDLGMHTADNRLPVFARRPAPVQVTWLACPGSTGLAAMDYRLTDPYLDPPGFAESFCTEKTIVLPHTFGCYDPLEDSEIPITPLPAAANGFVTFACLNTARKYNDPLMSAWSAVLRQVPNSKLMIRTESQVHRQRATEFMYRQGVTPDRIEFVRNQSRAEYMRHYHRVDIALDTFPYSGHTTTCDNLWMGVPVVSLIGDTGVGRGGYSILSNIGLTELAADSVDDYVRKAVDLATDIPRLTGLRGCLRPKMQSSPLMDGPRFASEFEKSLRQAWQGQSARPKVSNQSGR